MYMAKKTDPKPKDRKIQNANLKTDAGPGRPKGQRNYATIYRQGLYKLAELNGIEPDELEEKIMQKGIKKALNGDLGFYKDMQDRLHGKPMQRTEITGKDGKSLFDPQEKAKMDNLIDEAFTE